jgi:hypothetical protein
VAVTSCSLVSTRSSNTSSGIVVTGEYNITASTKSPAHVIETEARSASPNPLPKRGNTFSVAIDSTSFTEEALVVDSVQLRSRATDADAPTKWRASVTWKQTLSNGVNGIIDLHLPPRQRRAEFWMEQMQIARRRDIGVNQQEIRWPFSLNATTGKPEQRDVGANGPVTNSAGQRVENVPVHEVFLPIFVVKRNILNPYSVIKIVDQFGGKRFSSPKVNENAWDIWRTGQTASARRCMFHSVEVSRPQYYNDEPYYEMEVRVLYDPLGHDIDIPDQGDLYWLDLTQEAQKKWHLAHYEAGGLPVRQPINLKAPSGELAADQSRMADRLTFRDADSKDFDALNNLVFQAE